jgi:coenzyme F420-reducing hydrogenase beta subunit
MIMDKRIQLNEIINGGYCIGCGACAAASHGKVKVIEDEYLRYQARITTECDSEGISASLAVCPFSNENLNEDQISQQVFDPTEGQVGEVIGYYQSLYAGHVTDENVRIKVTSGGIISWTLSQLLERGLIDAVIHVKKVKKPGTLFEYGISRTPDEVLAGAKSRYYPVEISKMMDFVRNNDGRYAFVGLPCFVKAVRSYLHGRPGSSRTEWRKLIFDTSCRAARQTITVFA